MWVDAKERLPEKWGVYLTYDEIGDFAVCEFVRQDFNFMGEKLDGVLYWSEIPQPPRTVEP